MAASVSILAKGAPLVRYAMCLARCGGKPLLAAREAEQLYKSTPQVAHAFRIAAGIEPGFDYSKKAATDAGSTTDATWAAPLAAAGVSNDFIPLLYSGNALGAIAAPARRVPPLVRVPRVTTLPDAFWVAQGAAKPMSAGALDLLAPLLPTKIVAFVVLSKELIRFSTPSAEEVARRSLLDTLRFFADRALLDPNIGATAANPASLTNGATSHASTGATVAAITADLSLLVADVGTELSAPLLIMQRRSQISLALLGMTDSGGKTIGGIPIVATSASPAGQVTLVDAAEVLLADDGNITIDASEHAALQFESAPASGAQAQVSLWQDNFVALRIDRFLNFALARADAVAYLTGCAW